MRNLRTMALVMSKDHDRGLQQSRLDHGSLVLDMDTNTVGSEIRHVHFYVESLRWELRHKSEHQGGNTPHVQMWLL